MKQAITIVIIAFLAACSSEVAIKEEPKEAVHESNDSIVDALRSTSELAQLMRSIYVDMHDNKELLASGTMPSVDWGRHVEIKKATPTDPDDSGVAFDAFADAYMFQLNAFSEASDSTRIMKYNNLVNACLNCHQQYCVGPMDIIRTLEIKN